MNGDIIDRSTLINKDIYINHCLTLIAVYQNHTQFRCYCILLGDDHQQQNPIYSNEFSNVCMIAWSWHIVLFLLVLMQFNFILFCFMVIDVGNYFSFNNREVFFCMVLCKSEHIQFKNYSHNQKLLFITIILSIKVQWSCLSKSSNQLPKHRSMTKKHRSIF